MTCTSIMTLLLYYTYYVLSLFTYSHLKVQRTEYSDSALVLDVYSSLKICLNYNYKSDTELSPKQSFIETVRY